MRLELYSIRFDPDTGGFPSSPLEGGDGPVLHVVEHFFHHQGWPWLLLVVHRQAPVPPRVARAGREPDPELDESDRALYERLRVWRNGRADADGLPPYAVFTNRQLVELVRRKPTTKAAMTDLSGVGPAKVEKYAQAVLEVLGVQP